MTMRPVPGPWLRLPPAFRPRYGNASPNAVVFTARCDCGSGLDATWTESRDDAEKPLTCECTCTAVREGAA